MWPRALRRLFPPFLPLVALIFLTLALSVFGTSAARYIFILGCLAVSFLAMRAGAPIHFQTTLVLFCLSPFLRRVVDLTAGFNANGIMLTGPFLAIALTGFELRISRFARKLEPIGIVAACVVYAALLSLFEGDLVNFASGSLKWIAPLIYGAWLHQKAQEGLGKEMIEAAANVFIAILPVLGLYAVYQYIAPPDWDRYWMTMTPAMWSIGLPRPYEVRVFSTMNAPAAYASYSVCALILTGICRQSWKSPILAVPCLLGVMLSLYRTAWLSLVVGLLMCLICGTTRRRAGLIVVFGSIAIVAILAVTPFSDVITDRFSTFGQGTGDNSVEERLAEFSGMLDYGWIAITGHGFAPSDLGQPGAFVIDGQTIACWYIMGLPVGLICLAAIIWAAVQSIADTCRSHDPAEVAIGAVMVGLLAQLPFAGIAGGELGVVFWGLFGIATGIPRDVLRSRYIAEDQTVWRGRNQPFA
jgi:hypothetical protein